MRACFRFAATGALLASSFAAGSLTGTAAFAHEPIPPHPVFSAIEPAKKRFASLLDIADELAGNSGAAMELRIERSRASEGGWLILVTEHGYEDDSVAGQQWRFLARRADDAEGGWQVIEAGERWRCYRGATPMMWQDSWCP